MKKSVLLVACLACLPACKESSTVSRDVGAEQATAQWRDELFNVAIDNLNHLDQFDSGAMLQEVGGRLGEWLRLQEPPAGWQVDALLAKLPKPLAEMPSLRRLDSNEMSPYDTTALREAIWLRDAAQWAAGKKADPLTRAQNLFDWTVRNIQLDPPLEKPNESIERIRAQFPWETLLFGRGLAADRAWLFVELARQQALDAVVLGIAPEKRDAADEQSRLWAVGVRIPGSRAEQQADQVYLFDPERGLPLAQPDRRRLGSAGQLAVQPMTLAELTGDPKLLDGLAIDAEHPYPVKPAELGRIVALVAASPTSLSVRMKLIEARLSGAQRVVLSASPSTQAAAWKKLKPVAATELWPYPFTTAYRQMHRTPQELQQCGMRLAPFSVGTLDASTKAGGLWKARVLHLEGKFTGEEGAIALYQALRPANDSLSATVLPRAEMLYRQARSRPTSFSDKQLREACLKQAQVETNLLLQVKVDASYWLGLVSYERANYPTAIDYFAQRTLEASPQGPWTRGARYNLARCYEALGQREKAVEELRRLDAPGPLMRAAWLEGAK